MSAAEVAIVVFLFQQGLLALLWALAALLRLSRVPSLHWALATLAATGAMAIILERDDLPRWIGYWLANMLAFVAMLAFRRGMRVFARRPSPLWPDAGLTFAYAVVLGVVVGLGPPWAVVALAAACLGTVLASTSWVVLQGLRTEFGRGIALACAAPFAVIATLLALRGVAAAVVPEAVGISLHQPRSLNVTALIGFVVSGLLLNIGLIAMVLLRLLLRLKHIGDHDALTGLRNRYSIERALALEWVRRARHGQPFAVLALDIDHFKTVNDRHGHPAGDAVLRALAATLRTVGRGTDLAARTGGEEFWLLMPQTALDGAMPVAERLLKAVRGLKVAVPGAEIRFTVSIGVAEAQTTDADVDALLRRLDAALYRAKNGGRDRIETARDAAATEPAAAALTA